MPTTAIIAAVAFAAGVLITLFFRIAWVILNYHWKRRK